VKLSITVKSNWQITWICIEGTLQRTNIALINFSWDRHDQWKPHYSMINQRTERNRETDRQSERDRQTERQTDKQRERERERDDWLIVMISISYTMTCLVFENNKLLDLDWLCSGNLACHRNEREYIFEMVYTFWHCSVQPLRKKRIYYELLNFDFYVQRAYHSPYTRHSLMSRPKNELCIIFAPHK
jgi:hypothetical protein